MAVPIGLMSAGRWPSLLDLAPQNPIGGFPDRASSMQKMFSLNPQCSLDILRGLSSLFPDSLLPQGSDLLPLDMGTGKSFEQFTSAPQQYTSVPQLVDSARKDLYHDHHTPTASNGSADDTVETWGAASECPPVGISPFAAIQTHDADWLVPQRQGSTISDSDDDLHLDEDDCMEGEEERRAGSLDMNASCGGDSYPSVRRSQREATRASTLATVKRCKEPKEKKKVGRPIAYTGDPNDPSLTEAERRRVKRRIANRESARRVRQRRLQEVDSILVQIEKCKIHNAKLMQLNQSAEEDLQSLIEKAAQMEQTVRYLQHTNQQLEQSIAEAKQTLRKEPGAVDCEAPVEKEGWPRSTDTKDQLPQSGSYAEWAAA